MGTGNLQELDIAATARLDEQFRDGTAKPDLSDFCRPFGREVDLESAAVLFEEAFQRYADKDRAESDRWLGPRVHAAIRLTRREASRPGVWRYLAVVAFPDYVRWRFSREEEGVQVPAPLERFVGAEIKHAIGRLWWMAEMFRNGVDYSPAAKALSNQDLINSLFRNDTAHHRPTALGAVRVLVPADGKPVRSGREANALAKAANTVAGTVLLDSFAPDEPLDDAARMSWIEQARDYDPRLHLDSLPEGPEDPRAPEESVARMEKLLEELLAEAPVRGKKAVDQGRA